MFFDFFMTASSNTYSFDTISDNLPSKYGLKKYGFARDVPEKVEKQRQAIALAARGGCGGLGQLWEALAELWEALSDTSPSKYGLKKYGLA